MMSRISKDLAAHHAQSKSFLRYYSSHRSHMPSVAIIGAGFAGLRCADVLLRNGVNVTIFEARNRLGGRVFQQSSGSYSFDMGPNWIHGTEGNPIMTLAEKTCTVVLEPEEKQIIYDTNGNLKPDDEAQQLGAETWATIVNAFKYSNEHCGSIDPHKSLLDYFTDDLLSRFPDDEQQVQQRVNEARMWGPFIGDPIDRQSLRNFYLEECLEGENVIVASTYQKILAEVARTAQQDAEIKLGVEVAHVEYRKKSDSQSKITLTTTKGEQHQFDEVVVTCPLGWLKIHKENAFTPALPPRLSQAIDNISYGNLEKIYVTFPSAWWLGDAGEELSNEDGGSPRSMQSTSSNLATPLFVHFHHPSYHPNPASKQNEFWNQSVVSLAHFPGETAQPTLLFYMYGPCSRYVTSMIASHEPGSSMYNSLLKEFVDPFITRLPCYSNSNPACNPVSFVATQWSTDPYAGFGSYSNFQVGLDQGDEDIKCMRDAGGLSDEGRGLWLAGEHTAPFVAIGTSTGAYWSGEAVARRILHRQNVDDVKTDDEAQDEAVGEGKRKELDEAVQDGANLTGLAI